MKKQLIINIIAFLLIVVWISGCNDSSQTKGDTDKVELLDTRVDKHTATDGSEHTYYNGTVKNIAGHMLNKINITVKFYDNDNNYLFSEYDAICNLVNSYTRDFSVHVDSFNDYYEYIDHVEYEFTVS